ncbi:DUF1707 and DUF4190 domain-containing protein [Nocardia concava]|uniref:DUF1707 and DUF4190 domain-containing protein n=1 Tax=Nocardia concava TaxID=257281 RepID=UPI00031C4E85|nr:DUF1707 and DUF4190 domain-containing protein [Nocardia concava]
MEPHWAGGYFLASDADRDRAIETLNQNFQAGRLTVEELSERIGRALNSRTCAELDVVMTGLPWQRASLPVYPNMPGYPNTPGYRPYYAPAGPRSKGMGITSFVLGVFGFICGLTAVPAVILGLVALTVDAERRDDKGFAIAGLAVGLLWMTIFAWIFFR